MTHVHLVSAVIAFTINLCEPEELYADACFDSSVSNFRLHQNNEYTTITTYGPDAHHTIALIAAKAVELNPGWWCVTFTDGPRYQEWVKREKRDERKWH
jgi:hypothetical protein